MKSTSSTNQGTLYRSWRTLGKAIKRLEHSLLSSPHKQRFVVEKLARSVGVRVPVCSSSSKSTSAESEEKRELVHSFYRTDNISWQAPSNKCMTRECSICVDLIDEFTPQSRSVTLQYYQWKSTDSRIERIVMTDTVDSIFNELKKQLSTFLLHTFVSCFV